MSQRILFAALVGAGLTLAGCSDDTAANPDAGPDLTAPDAGGDLITGDVEVDTGAPDADVGLPDVVEPPPCTEAVCYEPLASDQYPEAQTPPRHALHCNERGIANGCPAGTECGDVTNMYGFIVPACVPLERTFDVLDVDISFGSETSADDRRGVPVQVSFASNAAAFPARDETRFDFSPWTSFITFTHRDSGRQWSEPIPLDPNDGFGINLRRGVHDVFMTLQEADFPGSNISTIEQRGTLSIDGAGSVVIDQGAAEVEVRLRYLGSPLTGAESQSMSVTLIAEGGRRFFHQYTSGERGITQLSVPPGTYTTEIASNGTLPSLFPGLPMTIELPIEVPETTELQIDLETELVAGTLEVNGTPAGEEGEVASLMFTNGERLQRVTVSPSEPGVFRAILWPRERYDVYYSNNRGAEGLLAQDWSPRDEQPLDLEVETELVTFTLDVSELEPRVGEPIWVNLLTRHATVPFANQIWHQNVEAVDGVAEWEVEMVPGERVDASINTFNSIMPQGRWQVADGLVVDSENDLDIEVADVTVWYEFNYQDGTPARVSQSQVYFEGLDGPDFSSVWGQVFEERATSMRVYADEASAYLWPSTGGTGIPYQRYELGTVDVEDGRDFVFEAVAYRMEGDVTVNGRPLEGGLDRWQTGYLQFLSPVGGGQTMWIEPGMSDYALTVGQGAYRVNFTCQGEHCVELGHGTQNLVAYDAVRLRP